MATATGQHIEYTLSPGTEENPPVPTIVRVFSSEVAALRSAVHNGNRHAFVHYGETLQEALDREAGERTAGKPIDLPQLKRGAKSKTPDDGDVVEGA